MSVKFENAKAKRKPLPALVVNPTTTCDHTGSFLHPFTIHDGSEENQRKYRYQRVSLEWCPKCGALRAWNDRVAEEWQLPTTCLSANGPKS
jgi:hypothetical protein